MARRRKLSPERKDREFNNGPLEHYQPNDAYYPHDVLYRSDKRRDLESPQPPD